MEKCARIQRYHLQLFAEYLEKLRKTPDGDGSLLDHVILFMAQASAIATAIPMARCPLCFWAEEPAR